MFVLIKGIRYKVLSLPKKKYIKLHGDKEYAHFYKSKKELVFRDDHIEKKIILHEVVHAFIASLHLASCDDITLEDFEEIICEMLEEHLMDINRISNEIYKAIKPKKVKNARRKTR
jgi:hypothetical protein